MIIAVCMIAACTIFALGWFACALSRANGEDPWR